MQSITQAGHIAMPENRPDTAKQRLRTVFRLHPLRCQIANQRLRHRQPNRSHSHTSIFVFTKRDAVIHARIGTRKTRRFIGNHDSAVPTILQHKFLNFLYRNYFSIF
jgi:hypothetical protein